MSKFEIKFNAEMKTLSEQQPSESGIEKHLKGLGFAEVLADAAIDEEEYTSTDADWVWSVLISAEYECDDDEIDGKVAKAVKALQAWGLVEVDGGYEQVEYSRKELAMSQLNELCAATRSAYRAMNEGDDTAYAKLEGFYAARGLDANVAESSIDWYEGGILVDALTEAIELATKP